MALRQRAGLFIHTCAHHNALKLGSLQETFEFELNKKLQALDLLSAGTDLDAQKAPSAPLGAAGGDNLIDISGSNTPPVTAPGGFARNPSIGNLISLDMGDEKKAGGFLDVPSGTSSPGLSLLGDFGGGTPAEVAPAYVANSSLSSAHGMGAPNGAASGGAGVPAARGAPRLVDDPGVMREVSERSCPSFTIRALYRFKST